MPTPTLHSPDLRGAFRAAAASTWVVTGSTPDGPVGFTAISITSVSVDPAMVSFNLAKTSGSLVTISRTRRAALHLLSDEQHYLARRFAGERRSRFVDDGTWSVDEEGLPRVHDVAARLVVEVVDLVDAGDSYIAVGAVGLAETTDRSPLVHHDGGFHPLPSPTPNGA